MKDWDWEYLFMSDEDFAYVTELTREKIEQANLQDLKQAEHNGTEFLTEICLNIITKSCVFCGVEQEK